MENQDRELLELAAKAVGVELQPMEVKNVSSVGDDRFIGYMVSADKWPRGWFNPITDDGDALRLAVKLRISIAEYGNIYARAYSPIIGGVGRFHNADDLHEAVRYAIVKVAADIGRGME